MDLVKRSGKEEGEAGFVKSRRSRKSTPYIFAKQCSGGRGQLQNNGCWGISFYLAFI